MKNYFLLSLFLILIFSFSGCSEQKNLEEAPKKSTSATEDVFSMKTYKSNLYGFQFTYPSHYSSSNEGYPLLPKYSSIPINLGNVGMENFSNGNEIFGVRFDVPYHSYAPFPTMDFSFEILTSNEELLKAPGEVISQEEIDQEAKKTKLKKYSQEEVRKYSEVAYEERKKSGSKISDAVQEVVFAGKKGYQYRITFSDNSSELHTFVSDGDAIYKIVFTDSPLMQEIVSSIKFKN